MGRAPHCLALLAAVAVVAVAHEARPCVIIIPTMVLPASGAVAPVNTHVWIFEPPLRRTANWARPPAPAYDADFVLRSVAPTRPEIPVATRECEYKLVELAPTAPLPANARFEVWVVPRTTTAAPMLLASFTTGTETDTTPPPRPAFDSAHLAVPRIQTSCNDTHEITLWGGTSASTRPPDILYGVWAADATGAIAWDAAPVGVLNGLYLDSHRTCMPRYDLWAAATPHIGVRAIDLAGNLSAPVELDVVADW